MRRIVAPAVVFKAEAIVGPDDLVAYLGVGRHLGRVSDLAYQNSLMVQFWSSLATRDTEPATRVALGEFPAKPPNHGLGHVCPLSRRHRLGDRRR